MRTFKVYYENRAHALIPHQGTLEEFLRSLEGKSIKDVLDDASYMRLYFGNKFGLGGPGDDTSEADLQKFVGVLSNWVNRDVFKHRPKEREYESPEFKERYDYDSYREARSNQSRNRMDMNKARRALEDPRGPRGHIADPDALEELKAKDREYQDIMDNHPYPGARRQIDSEYDVAVQDYHNAPLTGEYLQDDGSDTYDELITAFTKLGGTSETIVDVDEVDDDRYGLPPY